MFKCNNLRHASMVMLLAAIVFLSGCAHSLKYGLNQRDIVVSKATLPLKVQVAEFTDMRNPEERDKSVRKQKGYEDLGDYTYDRDFRGEIAKEISGMLVKHLNYSNVFDRITLGDYTSDEVSDSKLDSLNFMGIDAVLMGEIKHFYGYYDISKSRIIAYSFGVGLIAGSVGFIAAQRKLEEDPYAASQTFRTVYLVVAGPLTPIAMYLESLHERDIEYCTELRAKLIDTSTHNILWEDTCKVFMKEHKSMPSLTMDKFKVTIPSLREAVNKVIESISNVALPPKD